MAIAPTDQGLLNRKWMFAFAMGLSIALAIGCGDSGGGASGDEDDEGEEETPAVVASLATAPGSVFPGESTTLAWSSDNADTCTGIGFSTGGATDGSLDVTPALSTTYRVECTGEGAPAEDSATVIVDFRDVDATLNAERGFIVRGQTTTLTWSSEFSDTCTGIHFPTDGLTDGSSDVRPTVTTTYSMRCTGEGAPQEASATVEVGTIDASIAASVERSFRGDEFEITWSSSNAESCDGTNFDTGGAIEGTAVVAPRFESNRGSRVTCTAIGGGGVTATAFTSVILVDRALNQGAYNASSRAFQFGFNSADRVRFFDAPSDTDFTRWAMLHDGDDYRLYFMRQGSDTVLYPFLFGSFSSYNYGETGEPLAIDIVGFPADADTSSFSMLHDGNRYRIYRRSITNPDVLYEGAFNSATERFEFGFDSPGTIDIIGAPSDADASIWGVLHDGQRHRLFERRESGVGVNSLYHYELDPVSGDFELSFFESLLSIPVLGFLAPPPDRPGFAILHDGLDYRLYFQEPLE